MTPEDLNDAVDTLVPVVAAEPVLVQIGVDTYQLAHVEASTDGRLVLHAGPFVGFRRHNSKDER
jgi:hypothetical protein